MEGLESAPRGVTPGAIVTRFAPSPTGELHLGNARTALFNLLLARHAGGRFLLRIEDTDADRSVAAHDAALIEDLRWLGIDWDAGPDREDERGPYRQSERSAIYAGYFQALERAGRVYPCFCTPLELEAARAALRAAGKPPRYPGTCRELTPPQQSERRARGLLPTLRFRVLPGERLAFADFVHGAQSFSSEDIGDFVVRRADGTAAFFFSNAVDDARMGVTHVLRGEDHLTNTPRQLMILAALGLPHPSYGHVSLIVGADGTPLSKRHGATSVRTWRERGFLAIALRNYLFRLGHSSPLQGLLDMPAMAAAFDVRHLGRAPARFDAQQLGTWQKEAVQRLAPGEAADWLAPLMPAQLEAGLRERLIRAVLPNVLVPEDARTWVQILTGPPPELDASAEARVRAAGADFFAAAAAAARAPGADLAAIAAAARAASGRKGAELYQPLRLALTGLAHGPELAALLAAMPPPSVQARLARFAHPSTPQ